MSSFPVFLSFAHIFLILKAMAKKAKSIVTLSSPTCRNLLYAMLYFICPKTASGSIHRLSLCLTPSSETSLSRACLLYWFNRWLTSIIRFPRALNNFHAKDSLRIFVLYTGHFWWCIRSLFCHVWFLYGSYVASLDKHNNPPPHCNGDFPHGTGWEYNGDAALYGSSCTWQRPLSHFPAWTGNFLPSRNRSLPHRYPVSGYSDAGRSGRKW